MTSVAFVALYISYGPPDEKETHPSGGTYERPSEEGGGTTSTYPFEKWRYRYIEGVGQEIIIEFVDTMHRGIVSRLFTPRAVAGLEAHGITPLHPPRPFEHTRFTTLLDPDGRHVRVMTPWQR